MKGSSVFKKLIVLTALAMLALTASAQIAAAETTDIPVQKSVKAQVSWADTEGCKYDDTHVNFKMVVMAQVVTVGMEPPSSIKVTYQMYDKKSNWTVASRAVTLKKSQDYLRESRRFTVEAGRSYTMKMRMSYKALGRTIRASKKYSYKAPSLEEIATSAPGCS